MRPKFVLGLKVDNTHENARDDDSDGNFFSSDSDNGPSLCLLASKPALSLNKSQTTNVAKTNKIVSFTDASSRITSFVSLFTNYPKAQPTFDQINLIPETQATVELTKNINLFINGKIKSLNYDTEAYDDNILCQMDIVKFSKDKNIQLEKYTKSKLDSRVSSLLYFLLSDTQDKGINAFNLLSCLEEFIKFPGFAPVATLFPDFTVKKVIEKLTRIIIQLFPKHPILESVIHSLAGIDSIASVVMEQQKALNAKKVESDDEDSDSFFNDLKAIAEKKTAPTFKLLIDEEIKNPLDSITAMQKIEKVSVNQPPSTVTYLLHDGTETMGPQPFSTWLLNLRDKTKPIFAADTQKPKGAPHTYSSHSYQSQPLFNPHTVDEETPKTKEYDEPYLLALFDHIDDTTKLLPLLPSTELVSYFPLYYPTLELINAKTTGAAIKRGCLYPSLIEAEYNAHIGLLDGNLSVVLQALEALIYMTAQDSWEILPITSLKTKRKMPTDHIDTTKTMVTALALADIEFVINGRSPLTGQRITGMIDADKFAHPAIDKILRQSQLYRLYSKEEYPPYVAFKVCFATALSVADSKPEMACNLIFEAISLLSSTLPQLIHTDPCRHATLFLAEMLEKTDRYFHAVLAFDNFFRANIKDMTAASAIAQIAHRNRDLVRAVFHYTEAIKQLIAQKSCDQALYLGKTISSIYSDNGLDTIAISLLTYLIKGTYAINIPHSRTSLPRDLPPISTSGSLKSPRSKTTQFAPVKPLDPIKEFIPDPKSINTVLIGCQTVGFMLSCRMFTQAQMLLDSISESAGNIMNKMISFLRAKLLLKQNRFHEFIQNLPQIDNNERRISTGSRLTIDSGAAFDSRAALIKMLAGAYCERDMFKEGIFWSEVMILTSPRASLRETGDGYFYRGKCFLTATMAGITNKAPINLFLRSSTRMAKVAKYIDDKKTWSVVDLASECLSSLSMARQCYDKIGALKKSVEASLLFADAVLRFFFHGTLFQNDTIEIGTMKYLLTCQNNKTQEVPNRCFQIKKEDVVNEIGIVMNLVDKNTARLMNPLFIIYSQILLSRLNYMKGEIETSKTYYEFAWGNFTKHFANGQVFAPRHLSFSTMQTVRNIATLLCDTLIMFPMEFINNHLVAFDLHSSVNRIMHMHHANKVPETKHPITPSVDMDSGILELENPKVPEFIDVLKDINAIEIPPENVACQKTRGFRECLRIINANIRQFETQKLTEDEMHKRNRSICLQMEKYAEATRHECESFNPVDTSFSVCLRHQSCLKRMIIMTKLFENIAIYLPFTGAVRLVPIISSPDPKSFTIKANGEPIQFASTSQTFSHELLEQMSYFLFIDKKNKTLIPKTQTDFDKDCKNLFGDLLNNEEIFGIRALKVPDTSNLGDESFFKSSSLKGALTTLDPGYPLVFVLGFELAALPIEFLFPSTFVVRAMSFTRLVLHKVPLTSYPYAYAFRYTENPEQLHNDGISRSVDIVRLALSTLGNGMPVVQGIVTSGRKVPMPFPLFSSNKSNEVYSEKFEFCHFVDICDESGPCTTMKDAALVVFTMADLVEMPDVIHQLMYKYPSTFFMFIPGSIIRLAFADMKLIFARQKIRFLHCMSNPDDPDLRLDRKFCKDGVMFVGALQRTLMEKYKAPIALFSPLGHT